MSFTDAVEQAVIESRHKAAVHSTAIDYALRAVIEILREPVVGNHEDALVDAAVMYLASLYEDYRFQAYLDRLASRPWEPISTRTGYLPKHSEYDGTQVAVAMHSWSFGQ